MPTRYRGVWASSTDPSGQTPSLTITSAIQTVIGIVATFAVVKGVDPMIVSTNVQNVTQAIQNIAAQGLAMLAAGYSLYHSMQMLTGLVRKWYPRVPNLPDLPVNTFSYSIPTSANTATGYMNVSTTGIDTVSNTTTVPVSVSDPAPAQP